MQSTFEIITFTDKSKRTGFGFPHTYTRNGMHAWNYGRGMAHDILEHINGVEYIGSYADEIQALGAGYYVEDTINDVFYSIRQELQPYIDKVIAFFCYGYEQAKAKYENYPVNDMFYVIADTFDNYISNHKLVKGEEFILTLDPDNMSAYLEKKSSLALAA